jgi:hypothetical protein
MIRRTGSGCAQEGAARILTRTMALATAAESCAGVIAGAGIAGAGIAGAAASVVIWTKVASDSAPGRAIVAASRSSLE